MTDLLIPDLDEEVRRRLEKRARRNSRSVEAEVRIIRGEAAGQAGFEEAGENAAVLRREADALGDMAYEHFKGRGPTDDEFARSNAGIAEINSRSQMRIPDFEAGDFEDEASDQE